MKTIKILFLAANPQNTAHLKLDEEIRSISNKIRAAEYRDSLELISAWAVRPDDLLQLLNEHKPHIVHFSGHGSNSGEVMLLDVTGNAKPVSTEAIKMLFTTLKDNVKIVFLNACYSQDQAKAITSVIDYAIGMDTAIGDNAAITFAASFYRAIGFGRSVKESFEQAKTALLLESIPEEKTPHLMCAKGIDPSKAILIDLNITHDDISLSRISTNSQSITLSKSFQELVSEAQDIKAIQAFIQKNPEILNKWWKNGNHKMVANLKMGEHLVNFALGDFQPTLGTWNWMLINLNKNRKVIRERQ